MANKTKKTRKNPDQGVNIYGDAVSDMPLVSKSNQDVEHEIFGKAPDPNKIIDMYEEQLGYPKAVKEVPRIKYYNRVFTVTSDDDSKLFNKLLNNPDKFRLLNI